jgi:hypothetical protein
VAVRLNRKILCFLDEHGTAGHGEFYLGAVLVFAQAAGNIDKRFSDLLPSSVNEVHASKFDDRLLQCLLTEMAINRNFLMINRKHKLRVPAPPRLYAQAVIETVKVGIKRFREEVAHLPRIGNIDVIVDANHHNTAADFADEIAKAQLVGGVFRGVNSVAQIDSAASRLLQLADVAAYSRKWYDAGEFTAATMRQRFGVHIL